MAGGKALRILMIGRSGQLAQAVRARGDATVTALGREEIAPDDGAAVARCVAAHAPDAIVNAAAYTAVDAAESDVEAAYALNARLPGHLAAAAAAAGIPLVHVSTDYVFDGSATGAYRPGDPVSPLGVYGASKRAGEEAILDSGGRAVILRTSWVFSATGRNFVKTMLRLGHARDVLTVVDDQRGRPTAAADLADAALCAARDLAGGGAGGLFHVANAGATTWCGFARAIIARGASRFPGLKARVDPIPTSAYPTPARRPANSELDTSGFEQRFGLTLRPWEEALDEVLDRLAADGAAPDFL